MTKLMDEAIERLRSLPEDEQDAVAGFVLSELEENRRWDETSSKYPDKLRSLADKASADFRASRTSELDPDTL